MLVIKAANIFTYKPNWDIPENSSGFTENLFGTASDLNPTEKKISCK